MYLQFYSFISKTTELRLEGKIVRSHMKISINSCCCTHYTLFCSNTMCVFTCWLDYVLFNTWLALDFTTSSRLWQPWTRSLQWCKTQGRDREYNLKIFQHSCSRISFTQFTVNYQRSFFGGILALISDVQIQVLGILNHCPQLYSHRHTTY